MVKVERRGRRRTKNAGCGYIFTWRNGENTSGNREWNNEFGVCYLIFFPSSPSISPLFVNSIQICTHWENDSIEFIRLEELKEQTVREMQGNAGYEW